MGVRLLEETLQEGFKFEGIVRLALPNYEYSETHCLKLRYVLRIPFGVAPQLRDPVTGLSFRKNEAPAAFMTMPEAAVDENRPHSAPIR